MDLDFNFLIILILFGAFQGYILCIYIYQKRHVNRASVKMFLLFLFCLSFLNMMYAFLDLELFKYYRPMHMFPLPYKWIIGPAFYFYIKDQFDTRTDTPYYKKEWLLFMPAIIYGFVRLYWFYIAVSENSYRITQVLVASNYFRVQEIVYLTFNILLGLLALRFLAKKGTLFSDKPKHIKAICWLKMFTKLFILLTSLALLLFGADLALHGSEGFLFLYPVLISNVLFIYWIGYIGFTKPRLLFNTFITDTAIDSKIASIKIKVQEAMNVKEAYKNPKLTLNEMASEIDTRAKDLSMYINERHQMNFSEFLNFHRIEHVKKLLTSEEAEKYTLVTLAEEAGFSSKSSFNAIFKKVVGMTPSAYKKQFSAL